MCEHSYVMSPDTCTDLCNLLRDKFKVEYPDCSDHNAHMMCAVNGGYYHESYIESCPIGNRTNRPQTKRCWDKTCVICKDRWDD